MTFHLLFLINGVAQNLKCENVNLFHFLGHKKMLILVERNLFCSDFFFTKYVIGLFVADYIFTPRYKCKCGIRGILMGHILIHRNRFFEIIFIKNK